MSGNVGVLSLFTHECSFFFEANILLEGLVLMFLELLQTVVFSVSRLSCLPWKFSSLLPWWTFPENRFIYI